MEKKCYKCGTTKSFSEFHNNRTTKDGKQHYCKVCHCIYKGAMRGTPVVMPGVGMGNNQNRHKDVIRKVVAMPGVGKGNNPNSNNLPRKSKAKPKATLMSKFMGIFGR